MDSCEFCRIVSGKSEAAKIYEDQKHLALMDRYPIREGHVLVIPKKHYKTVLDMSDDEVANLFSSVYQVALAVKKATGVEHFTIAVNVGSAAFQQVFHAHAHIIPAPSKRDPAGGRGPSRMLVTMEELHRIAKSISAYLE